MAYFAGVSSIILILCAILTPQSLHGISTNEHLHHHRRPKDSDQLFFRTFDLKQRKKLPIYFPMEEPFRRPPLLSKEQAQSIPFSSIELPKILNFFDIAEGSVPAESIQGTINKCEKEAIRGEVKFCATSMDSLIDSAHKTVFGPDLDIKVATTKIDRSKNPTYIPILQNYTITENPQEFSPSKSMACHIQVYPYVVYYCHHPSADHNLYKIHLIGDNGWKVEALGMCHTDTSNWEPSHIAFLVLNTQPGKSSVCHFFSESDLVLLPFTINV